jgi:PASTA domain
VTPPAHSAQPPLPAGTPPPDILIRHWGLTPDNFPEPQPLVAASITFTRTGELTVRLHGCGKVSGRYRVADLRGGTRPSPHHVPSEVTGRIQIEITGQPPTCSITVSDPRYLPPDLLDLLRSVRTFSVLEFLSLRDAAGKKLTTGLGSRCPAEIPSSVSRPPEGTPDAGPDAPIPDIMGLLPDEAMQRLLAAGFRATRRDVQLEYGTRTVEGERPFAYEEPEVLGVTPAVGHTLPPGQVVQVYVSAGPLIDLLNTRTSR